MTPISITLLLLLFVIILFVTEKLPLAVTSMIALITLVLTGVLSPKDAFAGFVDNNLILFVAMFIIGGAFFETGMANKTGGIVTKFAHSERELIVAVMTVTGLMSGFLSNTGTAAVLIPVVIGIAAKSGFARSRLLLPLIFAAAMGGNLSLIGAPGNLLGKSALQAIGADIGFFEYGYVGLPILVVGIAFFATVGYKFLPNKKPGSEGESVYDEAQDFSSVPAWKQKASLIIMVLTIIAMIFEKQIGIKFYLSGCIGAIILVATGVISEKQAYKSIDLQTLFVYGGTLALAKALEKTGAGAYIADSVIGLLGSNASPFMLLAVVLLLSCVMTNFMSNFATAALLIPISLNISAAMGADPKAVIVATVIGSSLAFATPIGMPANMMVFAPGGYNFNDYVKAGLPMVIVGYVVSLILLPILFPFYH
ncbi:SLC13/DASS family transporter [Acidaminococcus sp. AM05-11]|jgi:anion transporter|uniref:SLC13 family permease n=1 Tax=Acidaminococcus sp. AM05-11 TaxID=2291997 RepID=UPI000E4E60BC|nr:SLC13 family permease [Acidaminococcus sp. AM05-11]RHK02436.1 SLC13/DASS family transporter [Acidaminococcus sp. AM05-11]